MMEKIASSRLQTPVEIIMDTQSEIKAMIKQALFSVYYMIKYNERVNKLIDDNLAEIENEYLRETSNKALKDYAKREYQLVVTMLNLGVLPSLVAFGAFTKKEVNQVELQAELNKNIAKLGKKDLNKAFTNLANSQAMVSKGQSVYGHAETTLRWEKQVNMVNELRNKTKLVICDSHSDCSKRCAKWQGRIYSLDGTTGYTEDRKKYVPLETATQVVDKYGNINGLLGYNCRHKLYEYKTGMSAVKVNERERKYQNKLTETQRNLEREIRKFKDLRDVFNTEETKDKYKQYKQKVGVLVGKYVDFCHKYNRVEYRSRIK